MDTSHATNDDPVKWIFDNRNYWLEKLVQGQQVDFEIRQLKGYQTFFEENSIPAASDNVEGRKHLTINFLLQQYADLIQKVRSRYPPVIQEEWINQRSDPNLSFVHYLKQRLELEPDNDDLHNWYQLIRKNPGIDYETEKGDRKLQQMIYQEIYRDKL